MAAAAVSHPQVVALSASQLQNKSFLVDSKQSDRIFPCFFPNRDASKKEMQPEERGIDEKEEKSNSTKMRASVMM